VFDFELTQDEMKKMAVLNKEKRYFNMTYQQIKDWMENYELWD
jgi:diketogulonate reductase-like aldo/keto reductase